jgi:exonuclease III
VSESVAKRTKMTVVDRNARKGEKPSDHAPVVMEL